MRKTFRIILVLVLCAFLSLPAFAEAFPVEQSGYSADGQVNVFSVLSAVLFSGLYLTIVFFLVRKTNAMLRSARVIGLMTLLAFLRILLPFNARNAITVHSFTVLPAVQRWLQEPLVPGGILSWGQMLLRIWLLGALVVLLWDIAFLHRNWRERRHYT